jgi:hypothetical protein
MQIELLDRRTWTTRTELATAIVEYIRSADTPHWATCPQSTMKPFTFRSVKDPNTKIRAFIDGWNDRSHPFVWTKIAKQNLARANRPTAWSSRH